MTNTYTYKELEGLIEYVIAAKDTYFHKHPNATNKEKDDYMQVSIQEIQRYIEEWKNASTGLDEQQHSNYLKARLLCISPEYNAESEKLMVQFVKFHPNHLAWNILGEIYWRKNDHEMAKSCFEDSQKHVPNKEGMVKYSLLLRSIPCSDSKMAIENIKLSIQKAYEAIIMDHKYGKAWYAMANGYFNLYFDTPQKPEYLRTALMAYQHANEDQSILYMPEFHFYKGMAHKCNEDFEAALRSLDDALHADPHWQKALDQYNGLLTFLNNIIVSLESKGKLTAQRYKHFIKSLEDQKLLGLYADKWPASWIASCYGTASCDTRLALSMCTSIEQGKNNGKVVLGKVVCQVLDPVPMSFTFCIMDSSGTCFAVTMCNIASGKGVKVGDAIAIPEPFVEFFDFEYKEKHYKFSWIKIENLLPVILNGEFLDPSWLASLKSISVFKPG